MTMHNDAPFVGALLSETAADQSLAKLPKAIEAAVARAAQWRSEAGAAPADVFKAPAGGGKTHAVRTALGKHASTLLQHGHVVLYYPTHALAAEAREDFRKVYTGLPTLHLRGRGQRTEGGEPLCVRSELAEELGGIATVVPLLCSNTSEQAPCRAGCRYYAQYETNENLLIFTTHSYLTQNIASLGPVSLRVIDESFWQILCAAPAIPFTRFMLNGANTGFFKVLAKARAAVFQALAAGADVCAELRSAGFDAEKLEALATLEETSAPPPAVTPAMPDDAIVEALSSFDRGRRREARALADLWRFLAEQMQAGAACKERVRSEFSCAPTTIQDEYLIQHFIRKTLPLEAPLIVVDADADPVIIEAVVPGASFHSFVAPQHAHIIQVSDRTMSQDFLLHLEKGQSRRAVIRDLIEREVAQAKQGKVLVVTNKSVVEALLADVAPETEASLETQPTLCGAAIKWFGPSMRGVNTYKDFETIIVVGRNEQRPATVDLYLRCLYGDKGSALQYADGEVVRRPRSVVKADGAVAAVEVVTHPDPRGVRILSQLRECMTAQAVARLRLVHATMPKRVVLLCNVPLPELRPHEYLKFNDFANPRLERAFKEAGTRDFPLTPEELARRAPQTFRSKEAARNFLKRQKNTGS